VGRAPPPPGMLVCSMVVIVDGGLARWVKFGGHREGRTASYACADFGSKIRRVGWDCRSTFFLPTRLTTCLRLPRT
jgi:hypothetical protein